MVKVRWAAWGLPVLLVLAFGAQARAQSDESAAAPAPTPAPKTAPAPKQSLANVAHRAAVEVPDSRKEAVSKKDLHRMRNILSQVLKHLSDARREKDVVRLNCVNEKLTAIKGLLRISEEADVNMQEALARRDSDVAAHEFEKISIATNKCEQLLAESESCVGELAVYAGKTQVVVEIKNAPKHDITEVTLVQEPPPDLTRPPAASPYQ